MKWLRSKLVLAVLLIIASAVFYWLHYLLFHDAHHIFVYLIGDIAFVFIEVLLVTLVIHELLSERDLHIRLEKLNMVIGAFFSEVGTHLLTVFSDADPDLDTIRSHLIVRTGWTDADFTRARRELKQFNYTVDIDKINLADLIHFLKSKRDFLVRLLENPILLEHESFTDVLRAVFHLTEELHARNDLAAVPDTDRKHLTGDVNRAYAALAGQWLDYMKHLKVSYPFLFSLAIRQNPFDLNASPIVKSD